MTKKQKKDKIFELMESLYQTLGPEEARDRLLVAINQHAVDLGRKIHNQVKGENAIVSYVAFANLTVLYARHIISLGEYCILPAHLEDLADELLRIAENKQPLETRH